MRTDARASSPQIRRTTALELIEVLRLLERCPRRILDGQLELRRADAREGLLRPSREKRPRAFTERHHGAPMTNAESLPLDDVACPHAARLESSLPGTQSFREAVELAHRGRSDVERGPIEQSASLRARPHRQSEIAGMKHDHRSAHGI